VDATGTGLDGLLLAGDAVHADAIEFVSQRRQPTALAARATRPSQLHHAAAKPTRPRSQSSSRPHDAARLGSACSTHARNPSRRLRRAPSSLCRRDATSGPIGARRINDRELKQTAEGVASAADRGPLGAIQVLIDTGSTGSAISGTVACARLRPIAKANSCRPRDA
jgi:hypothetical protein